MSRPATSRRRLLGYTVAAVAALAAATTLVLSPAPAAPVVTATVHLSTGCHLTHAARERGTPAAENTPTSRSPR
ncbi:hypothetical protein [Amycolatopsis australiensis]|uniref:Tat (Twin-arginine translocation) pathway signal sequence n=1 Tax=Amycolatopsis australiensis TaxID=546364 RepID=A0A1K1LSD5_9PSEU|nr:hypothetical protein [Amycolatopsis australiensis]SFW13788.1 hypothetical protein SAMN04489730_0187 [Amycolatopsis australiensis]